MLYRKHIGSGCTDNSDYLLGSGWCPSITNSLQDWTGRKEKSNVSNIRIAKKGTDGIKYFTAFSWFRNAPATKS